VRERERERGERERGERERERELTILKSNCENIQMIKDTLLTAFCLYVKIKDVVSYLSSCEELFGSSSISEGHVGQLILFP